MNKKKKEYNNYIVNQCQKYQEHGFDLFLNNFDGREVKKGKVEIYQSDQNGEYLEKFGVLKKEERFGRTYFFMDNIPEGIYAIKRNNIEILQYTPFVVYESKTIRYPDRKND